MLIFVMTCSAKWSEVSTYLIPWTDAYRRLLDAVPWRQVVAALTFLTVIAASSFASEEQVDRRAPKKLTIVRPAPIPRQLPNNYDACLARVYQRDGKTYGNISIMATQDWPTMPLPREHSDGYSAIYELSMGDIVPMFGMLYRVETTPSPKAAIELRRLESREWPTGATVQKDTYVFVMNGSGGLHGAGLGIKRLVPPTAADEGYSAEIEILPAPKYQGNRVLPRTTSLQTVRLGGSLSVEGRDYKIVSLVPPNEQKRVGGWIELKPATEAAKTPTP